MAEEEALRTVSAALRKHIARFIVGPKCAEMSRICFAAVKAGQLAEAAAFAPALPEPIRRLVRHRAVQTLFAADYAVDGMCGSGAQMKLMSGLPRRLITEIARLLQHRPWALEHLKCMIDAN